jgi:hypothetical protein
MRNCLVVNVIGAVKFTTVISDAAPAFEKATDFRSNLLRKFG